MQTTLTATYDETEWVGEEEWPEERGGFTDPRNPWGGFRQEVPDGLCGTAFTRWAAEHVETVTCSLLEAAAFVAEFPGGVWDYSEGEAEQDYRTGVYTAVTLHVGDHAATVFELADRMRDCPALAD